MIITFVGTTKGNNSAKKAATMAAGLLSLSNNKSVCLMQINYDIVDCASYMVGKEMNQQGKFNAGIKRRRHLYGNRKHAEHRKQVGCVNGFQKREF